MPSTRLLVVGLGNPGPAYAGNRHNIGFMAAEAIARRHGFGAFRARFQGEIAEGTVAGRPILVLKPMTYMNESGRSVGAAARFYKIPTEDILVFHDELDLAAGKLRFKDGGGHAGHNGLKSLHGHVGPGYRRVRLGIGRPGEKAPGDKGRVVGHVLKDFAKADAAWLDPLLDAVAEQFPLLVRDDAGAFMSKVALAVNPPKPKRTGPPDPADSPDKRDSRAPGSSDDPRGV
jgi:peptidyl-tRNA hydrolase, PTH1 family